MGHHFKSLLHNNIRGSAREVLVEPSDIGLVLKNVDSEPLSTWTFDAISLDNRTHLYRPLPNLDDLPHDRYVPSYSPGSGRVMECTLAHDDLLTLRIFDAELASIIEERAPAVRKAMRESGRLGLIGIWSGIPDILRAVILMAITLGILRLFRN